MYKEKEMLIYCEILLFIFDFLMKKAQRLNVGVYDL